MLSDADVLVSPWMRERVCVCPSLCPRAAEKNNYEQKLSNLVWIGAALNPRSQ